MATTPRISMSFESQPRMLKDFLNDDSDSYSSNGFRKPCKPIVQNLQESSQLLRTRSRSASNTILAIHKATERVIINALKYLPFASIKSPSILPRSISRKLSGRKKDKNDFVKEVNEVMAPVKVKDILRWRSFRDLVEERSAPLDTSCSPNRCITTVGSTSSSTPRSSVGDSKEMLVDEYEQNSPVSVLQSPFQEDQDSIYLFNRSLASIERRKYVLMQRLKEFESCVSESNSTNLEHRHLTEKSPSLKRGEEDDDNENEAQEKAKQLLTCLNATSLGKSYDSNLDDQLLLDFFWHELSTSTKLGNDKLESELLRLGSDWRNGIYEGSFEWEVESKRMSYVKEMERGLSWNKFEEEKEDLAKQLENLLISSLVDEVLIDILTP